MDAKNQEAFLMLNTIESAEATPNPIPDNALSPTLGITLNTTLDTTIVLQPCGALNGTSGANFRVSLAQAIAHATAVVVDLLWVEEIDDQGIAILLAATRQAQSSGKLLSFLAMDASTRSSLDAVWEQRTAELSIQIDRFAPEFEQFLNEYKEAKIAAITALEMAKGV
jgi:anti-anti-sigma regulatory factor